MGRRGKRDEGESNSVFVSVTGGKRKKCLYRHRNAALERQALMRKNIFHAHCGGEVSASDVNWLLLCSQQSVHGSWHSLHMDLTNSI